MGGGLEQLSPRQKEVFIKIVEGESNKEIAYNMGLSPKTVDVHRAQVMKRLRVRSIVDLVKLAIREGVTQA
jgi:FixJ family two-component response regulator